LFLHGAYLIVFEVIGIYLVGLVGCEGTVAALLSAKQTDNCFFGKILLTSFPVP
jgi:hypothetical protein